MNICYVPIGVGTYHMETAHAAFDTSSKVLAALFGDELKRPEGILFSSDEVKSYIRQADPDLVILQNITFANAAYVTEVLKAYQGPLVLWTLREPVGEAGGRLKLNSLTGTFSAANTYHQLREDEPLLLFGAPEEEAVAVRLKQIAGAVRVYQALKGLKICQIGHTPQGFGFGRALDTEISRTFGAELVSIEARELINRAKGYVLSDCEEALSLIKKWIPGFSSLEDDRIPKVNQDDFVRLMQAYLSYVKEQGVGALSSRCWPDFFVEYGTPVCGVLSVLNAMGIPASCEADTYGALSMCIAQQLTGEAAFFGDPVALSEGENTLTFWHCGMASCSLARSEEGAAVGVHPNRKIGPTMEFGARAAEHVTILRIGKDRDGSFRLAAMSGKALEKPKQFLGTSLVVQTDAPVKAMVDRLLSEGWEPHYAVAYGDITEELLVLGKLLGLPVTVIR